MSRRHRIVRAWLAGACIATTVLSARAEDTQSDQPDDSTATTIAPPIEPQQSDVTPARETAQPPPGEARPQPSSLEIWGSAGPSVVFGEPANPAYARSFRRVGGLFELGVAYRSSYFVDPFLSVSYANLAGGESRLPDGPWGTGGTIEQRLGAWMIAPGVTSDIWRFRLRLALGLAIVTQNYKFQGRDDSSAQLTISNQLGVGFNALETERFRLDAEARAVIAPGADVSFVTLAVVARGDLVQFGR